MTSRITSPLQHNLFIRKLQTPRYLVQNLLTTAKLARRSYNVEQGCIRILIN